MNPYAVYVDVRRALARAGFSWEQASAIALLVVGRMAMPYRQVVSL